VCLHLSAQHTWPQLSVCPSSIVCPFCISSHPQIGAVDQKLARKLAIVEGSDKVGYSGNKGVGSPWGPWLI
jgi:hypothetical protein